MAKAGNQIDALTTALQAALQQLSQAEERNSAHEQHISAMVQEHVKRQGVWAIHVESLVKLMAAAGIEPEAIPKTPKDLKTGQGV